MSERRTLQTRGEVIEKYSRDFPAEIVEIYSRPLPGAVEPVPTEPTPRSRRKKRRVWKGLLILLAIAAVIALLAAGVRWLIWELQMPDDWGEDDYYYYDQDQEDEDAPITIPTVEPDADARLELAKDRSHALSAQEVYRKVSGAVVTVAVDLDGGRMSVGTGVIFREDGYILTNYHVIEGASTVKVTAYDGTTYDAAVIGGDEDYDIAVIKVEGTNFQPVVIGKSGSVQIGETVAAVGNPLGELTFSMSQGIVSCVNRAINVDGKPFNMIQVDCSINPGNSGGPLFNSYGEVIGIVSAKYSSYSNTTVEGIGFAIPIDDVLAMVKDIMTDGYVTNKPYIGITPQNMTAQMAQQYRYDVTQGVFVCSVEPGSAAEKAGLQMGDVITKIGDTAISDMNDLNAAKKSYRAGDTVTLTIYRAGGTKEVELTFDAVPQTQETAQDNSQQQQQGGSNGGYYYNPWDFFNSFFGNGYYGSSYSGESRDAA